MMWVVGNAALFVGGLKLKIENWLGGHCLKMMGGQLAKEMGSGSE